MCLYFDWFNVHQQEISKKKKNLARQYIIDHITKINGIRMKETKEIMISIEK